MIKLKFTLSLFLLLFSVTALAQIDFSPRTWHFIDTSIVKKRNLADLAMLLNNLAKKAETEQDHFNYARCLNYKIQLKDLKTEDTLYFKNSALLDTLLLQKQLPQQTQYALHIISAKRLLYFTLKYKRFELNRYQRKDILFNYAAFANKELDSIALQHFEKAKELAKQMGNIDIDKALWLSSDPLQFLFKPGLFDFVIAEQINAFTMRNQYWGPANYFLRNLLSLPQAVFITKLDSLRNSNNDNFKNLKLYSEWLAYNRPDPAAYYFIETLARKSIYNLIKQGYPEADKVYEDYLRLMLNSNYSTVKAHAVYQLCLLLNSQGNKYFPKTTYNYNNYVNQQENLYDTIYRFHPEKALELFQQHKQMLDSFFYLKNILLQMEAKIKSIDLQFSLQANNLPGEPLLAELKFKNADKLFYRAVRLHVDDEFYYDRSQKKMRGLLLVPGFTEVSVSLPNKNDFNYHNAYVKLDSLPAGTYLLLFADKKLSDTTATIRYVQFAVTGIAVNNNDARIYVLNRKTGMPLHGAKVNAGYYKEIKKDSLTIKKYVSENYIVNKNGYVIIRNNSYTNLTVNYSNDTISESISIPENEKPEDIYDKDEFDGLVEFYEDNAIAYIYTDRSIYRPGQTVYYKAIFITTNAKTGEPMLMNKQNLRGKLFGRVYKKWLKEGEPWLIITDPFNKEMDSLKIEPNEFGSVSGSFKIPKTAATGGWDIAPDYIEHDWQSGSFKVEEYKRPSYEITIDKQKKELRIKDEFSFKVRVRSFAGAPLNNVRIEYTIQRSGQLPVFDSLQMKLINNYISNDILTTTGYTDAEGMLQIFVSDTSLNRYNLTGNEKWNFDYSLHAEAIDATGESYTENARINISSQPVKIKLPLNEKLNRAQLPELLITAEDKNAGTVNKTIRIKFYKTGTTEKLYTDRKLTKADEWLYGKAMLEQWFPQVDFYFNGTEPEKKLVWQTTVNTGSKEKMILPPAIFVAGNYMAEAVCEEDGKILGELNRRFTVFDAEVNKLPEQSWSFNHLYANSVLAGDSAKYYYGSSAGVIYSIFHIAYYAGKKKKELNYFYEEQKDSKGIHLYKLKIPEAAIDQLKLTQIFILNNQVFKHEERIFVTSNKTDEAPEIIIEKYRKNLAPGTKEMFTVSVKTKNENIAAELMTTMYDASLDKLQKHTWDIPRNKGYGNISTDWPGNINSITKSADAYYNEPTFTYSSRSTLLPLWWVNPLDYAYTEVLGDVNHTFGGVRLQNGLTARVAGLNIQSVNSGVFGDTRITLRGIRSLTGNNQPLIILDGVIYEGDLSKIAPQSITQLLVLKGADASAIYGSRAAQGVIVLSTKGDIIFPLQPDPVIIPRKNFNESAFFFSAVHADKNGSYSFSFTMPESVTEWNWKMLAHTKLAKFIYAERKLNTQLPLMVQPNMPRLVYQGDRIILQSRISNLDSLPAAGKIICTIEDVVTGEDITGKLVSLNRQDFSLNKKENKAYAFEIKIPVEQLQPLKIIIKVRSANFTDGEEHIIPVLSPKIFVRENKPFYFINNADTVLKSPSIPAGAELYGMALSVDPKPQAALINSLPWLASYPYGCAEQTFNKLLANTTAIKLMQSDKTAQQSFNAAKEFVNADKDVSSTLPDELNEETMPWLNKANQSALLKKQLFNLLDTSKTLIVINDLLQKIYKFQNADGGLGWFNGGESNFYISNYLLKGFGLMNKDSIYFGENSTKTQHDKFIKTLINYTDREFNRLSGLNKSSLNNLLHYVYARSFWQKKNPVTDSMLKTVQASLHNQWKDADAKSLYNQALLIITSLRFAYGDEELVKISSAQLNSIRQLAIADDQNGVRWKELADADDLNISSEETITLLAEAFKESGSDENIRSGVVKWLLTARNEHHWGSTKATAAAIDLLFKNNRSVIGETQTITASISDKKIMVTDDLLKGSSYNFSTVNSIPSVVSIKKEKAVVASGSLIWYYFTTDSLLNNLNKDIQLDKRFYKWNEELHKWDLINGNTILKIADKIKVILTILSSKSLPFVFIGDKRAAAFEPLDNSSGYEYAPGFSYYKSVRDAGFQFFAENIPSGRHEISYELKVSQEGNFTSGPAVLQCMYKPEVSAYSNSVKIVTVR